MEKRLVVRKLKVMLVSICWLLMLSWCWCLICFMEKKVVFLLFFVWVCRCLMYRCLGNFLLNVGWFDINVLSGLRWLMYFLLCVLVRLISWWWSGLLLIFLCRRLDNECVCIDWIFVWWMVVYGVLLSEMGWMWFGWCGVYCDFCWLCDLCSWIVLWSVVCWYVIVCEVCVWFWYVELGVVVWFYWFVVIWWWIWYDCVGGGCVLVFICVGYCCLYVVGCGCF